MSGAAVMDKGEIEKMFSRLAPQYRRFNRWSSLGQDERWRRVLMENMSGGEKVLDIGAGTGDLSFLALEKFKEVVGADISPGMLAVARSLSEKLPRKPQWVLAGADSLPFENNSFNAVISAYVMRNLQKAGILKKSFQEIFRVLKPHGELVFLDLTRPGFAPLRWGHWIYTQTALPFMGRLIMGKSWPGNYLRSSIENLSSSLELERLLSDVGFRGFKVQSLWGGVVSLFKAEKC